MWDFWLNDASKGASVWAMIALVIFIGLLMYLGVHRTIAKMLDERIRKIEVDLAEAEQLRKEAKALLDDYARRREEAEKEAQSIVDAAREEAFRLTAEAKESLEAMVARREKAVTDKIAQAEAQAIAEVRARSADLAVEAARVVLTRQMATKGDALVDQSIKDVASKLN